MRKAFATASIRLHGHSVSGIEIDMVTSDRSAQGLRPITAPDMEYTVIAGYRFFDLKNKSEIRYPLRSFCRQLDLVGTILLSDEGINCYVAGTHQSIERFKTHLHDELLVPTIEWKEHRSLTMPWRRMLVKLKKEIITMGFPDIRPADFTAKNISPKQFKEWLDTDKDMMVIDTRNDYEVKLGKFKTAIDLHVANFTEFALRARELPSAAKDKPVVMYCTGGIRCEKASALFLKHYGFKEVYQLKGGILNYFKEVGGDHFEGECLVFDRRVGLSPNEVESNQCFVCHANLSAADRLSERYQPFLRCPHCADIQKTQ